MQGVLFSGLQASGKTSFYHANFYRTHIRLSMDMLKTRHREKILFHACLHARQPLVIDNTNPEKEDRKRYIEALRSHGFVVIGYYFQSRIGVCLARNAARAEADRIPDVGLKATFQKIEVPDYAEGYDRLYYVRLQGGSFIVEDWKV